ncbi:tetratricopeptide repeat protein [Novosphingobium colocasiae]|nr:tetratricopeptide repeat protein [Novosphingobium colocasiae]
MRYTPAALALSLVAAISASASFSAPPEQLDPRAAALVEEGRTAARAGDLDSAIDAYESALTVQPGSVSVLLGLADATRRTGMQGKAVHYYRAALEADPRNLDAISGEGLALAEKGALDKAGRNLTRLKSLCGNDCPQAQALATAIASGPAKPRVLTAEAVTPKPVVSEN